MTTQGRLHGDTWRTRLVDVALAAAVTAVILVAAATSPEPSARPVVLVYLIAVAFGLLMLARRRLPVLVVVTTCLGILGYYALGLPGIELALPAAAALYSAAEAGRQPVAIACAAALLLYSYAYRASTGVEAGYLFGHELLTDAAIMAAMIALGDGRWHRHRLLAEQREALHRREAEQEADAARQVADERIRIARDLHDSVGHTMVALSLHTDAAGEALAAGEVAQTQRELDLVRDAAAETMRSLRQSLGVLAVPGDSAPDSASGPASGAPRGSDAPTSLEELLVPARDAGLEVTVAARDAGRPVTVDELTGALPGPVGAVTYRIVQEALTNTLRHAAAGRVWLDLERSAGVLQVTVRDDGRSAAAGGVGTGGRGSGAGGHGLGLAGMRARTRAIGGMVTAGPRPGGGFQVVAELPLTGVERRG